jgi:hypothetical protein
MKLVSRYLLPVLFLSIGNLLFGQERVAVAGSRISMIPPTKNAHLSDHYSVISVPDSYELSVVEFPISGLDEKMKEIDSAAYVKRGLEVTREFSMTVDGYTGKVIRVRSNLNADGVQFIFGDSTFFVMMSTLFTRGDEVLFKQIIDSYKSIRVNKSKKINWNKFLAFEQKTPNKFKLVEEECFPFKMIFQKDGVKNDSIFNDSYIWVQQLPNDGNFKNNQELMTYYLMNYLTPVKAEILKVIHDGASTIAGVETYQFIADCKIKDQTIQVNTIGYLGPKYAVCFQCSAMNPEDIPEIEKFLRNLKFK